MPPSAIIAEDEPVLRAGLKALLAQAWPELDVVGAARDGPQALRMLASHAPQVLFLDIQMPGASGLDVARAANGRCHVVFVTAYDQYAVAAFEEGAVDYVMKPFDLARLTKACRRVRERLDDGPRRLDTLLDRLAELVTGKRAYLRWLNVEAGSKVRLVTAEEICYFQADVKYTRVVTPDLEALIRPTLQALLKELDPAQFWQVHRSTIVNVAAIAEVSRDLRGRPILHLRARPERLAVSQPFAHRFHHM